MNSNNFKLLPVMGLKPIMKSVGFLCPGIYIISNSLEAGTWAGFSREEAASTIPCNQQAFVRAPSCPPSKLNTKGTSSSPQPHSFLAFRTQILFSHTVVISSHLINASKKKKDTIITVLANTYDYLVMGSLSINCLKTGHVSLGGSVS